MSDVLLLVAFWSGVVYLVMVLVSRRRERALAEARTAEARFRSLTELSADWFWETDAEHRITWISGGAPVVTLFGQAPTFGKRFWEIPRIEVEERALRAHRERLGRELPFFDLEISRTDDRGARQIHIVSGHCRKSADGRFLGYRGVGRDVTGERRAERGLAEAKERLELALDGGNLAEWHLDVVTDELDAGDVWVRFLGYEHPPARARGTQVFEMIHPDDVGAARASMARALKGEVAEYDTEGRSPTKGGGWKWLHARGRVTERDAAGRATRMSGIVADIDERKRAEAALRDAESRYRSLVEIAPDGILVHSGSLIEYANPAMARLLKAGAPGNLVGMRVEEIVHADSMARLRERLAYLSAGPGFTRFEERRLKCLDGSEIVTEVGAVSYLDRGRLVMLAMFRDVTESRKAREALAEREQRFRDVAEAAGEYVWESDAEGRFTYLSERVEAVLGYSRAELLGRRAVEFMPLGEERAVNEWFAKHGVERQAFRDLMLRAITKSGRAIWLSMSGVPMHDTAGRWTGYRGTAADVTARKQAEARIEYLTTRDALTGLANRTLLAERAAQAIANAARNRARLAVLWIDLDRFKLVNESHGHPAGDALLRAVAERLQNTLRREDTLARVGGDDFVLLWSGLRSNEEATTLAQRCLAVLGRPFTVEGHTLTVGASVGIALYPDDGRDFAELLKHADAAMYHAKDGGRGTFRFYAPALGAAAAARLRVENELRRALARSELTLHWQPALRGRGSVVGAEALVRWQHPERGLLLPEDFVPLAEETGLIGAVGDWTLERALSQAGAWQRSLPGKPWFAVNVTAPELAAGELFFQRLKSSLEINQLDGSRLELEVTERVLMPHLEQNIETLRRIGELGVRFAIDDFGTGYSSLAYLRGLPIHKLKIDRMFLRSIESNAADQAIVRTIASLARTLGISVAAEGVETAAQLEQLLVLGCEDWQGHHFSAPLDAAGFERLLTSGQAARAG
jgi:diguanylate cyclase (GGDEF)-like protein/PAS domain S-box-containing protein